jgi:hypothetical protein
MKSLQKILVALAIALPAGAAGAQDLKSELDELRDLVGSMRDDYEQRISDLESRLAETERDVRGARRDADEAIEVAEQTAINQSSGSSAANTFNPSIGAVLAGHFGSVENGWDEIPGFQPAGEIGTGGSGFALGEAEVNLKASVDNRFFGNLTLGLHEDDGELELELEESWLQTTSLPAGITITGGRFFSRAGYLNSFHFHADDFVDRPLPYQAFLGGRYSVDGLRASWIAPTPFLLELGGELNWGGGFPATGNGERSPGAYTWFAKIGGDVGNSSSWQAGLAYMTADAIERSGGHAHEHDENGLGASEAFTGDSDLTIADLVWKWAPDGNASRNSLKIQGEYFRRNERGEFAELAYDGEQDGWYLQGLWQFAPLWRVGLRHDEVNADNGDTMTGTELESPGRTSRRDSLMLDWSPSEFSRLRAQYARDRVLSDTENVWYLQYIMSIGAHGAHQY